MATSPGYPTFKNFNHMKKWALLIYIILRSIILPFYSFVLVESICLRRLRKNQSDKNVLWFLANFYISYKQFEKSKFQLEALQEYYGDLRGTILLLYKTYYRLGEYTKVVVLIEHSGELKGKDKENLTQLDCEIKLNQLEKGG